MCAIAPFNLYFQESCKWRSLPEWAECLIGLGIQMVEMQQPGGRVVTAVVLPTRAFAAAFVGLGIVIGKTATRDHTTSTAHFERLLELPPGTPVIYRDSKNNEMKGVLNAPEEYRGTRYLRVQVAPYSWHLVDEPRALNVQPARHKGKLSKKSGGRGKCYNNQFIDGLLGEARSSELSLCSNIWCVIVGQSNVLEHEIKKNPLASYGSGDFHCGYIQDVLRVKEFATESQSFRSILVPAGSKPDSETSIESAGAAVVFDGARGFINWAHLWEDNHQVLILDRTERFLEDAVSAVNARFSQNRDDGAVGLLATKIPAGAEVLSFREAI